MRTNFIKVKLIIFLTATFLFIGCSSAETPTDFTDSTNPTNPTYAVDGCGYSLPDIGLLGDFYDGTNNPDYRNFQWSRSSAGNYLGIQIVSSGTRNEVGYIGLSATNVFHGDLLRTAVSNGYGQATLYSIITLLPIDLNGNSTGEGLSFGQLFLQPSGSTPDTLYVSDDDLAGYTYGASNFFSGNLNYNFGTTGYRDGLYLGSANNLDLSGDAYYTHYTLPATTTSPTGIAIVKKQESTFFYVPCDAARFNSVIGNASLLETHIGLTVSIEDYLPNYKTTYPNP